MALWGHIFYLSIRRCPVRSAQFFDDAIWCISKTRSRNGPSYNTPTKFVDGGFSLDFRPHYVGEKRKINQSEKLVLIFINIFISLPMYIFGKKYFNDSSTREMPSTSV